MIVAIAIYLARQQWQTAHTKFRRDYYDRRLQIYRAAMTLVLVYRLLNPLSFVAFKMGRLRGGPSRTGAEGAYLDRYVIDEQRSSRPIFNATLRARPVACFSVRRLPDSVRPV